MKDVNEWAQAQFGHANLNDPRRTKRLVNVAARLANKPSAAICNSTIDIAEMEGAYRLIRNKKIDAKHIADAGFIKTAQDAKDCKTLLALEDTTTLMYSHSVKKELAHVNNQYSRGLLVHSILLFDPNKKNVVGLIEQQRWTRDLETKSIIKQCKARDYKEKESYKWEKSSINMQSRLGEKISDVISVCDREADIFEYITFKTNNKERFVVRSSYNRRIYESDEKLYAYGESLPCVKTKKRVIPQKGGRKRREATLEIKFAKVTLKTPEKKSIQCDVQLYYVSCIERGDNKNKLKWHLLTSESVTTAEEAEKIIFYYEKRWLIEDYHKVWKSEGTDVESLRMQTKENLERMTMITSFVAVRLLQLRFMIEDETLANQSCEQMLGTKLWKLLWLKTEKEKKLTKTAPNMLWAYRSIAKLGGWKDTKRTGRASVKVLWEGWSLLGTMFEGYDLAISIDEKI